MPYVSSINLAAKVAYRFIACAARNFRLTAKKNPEKRNRPHRGMQPVNALPQAQAQFHRKRQLSVGKDLCQSPWRQKASHLQQEARQYTCLAHKADDCRPPVIAGTDPWRAGKRKRFRIRADRLLHHKRQ